VDREPAGEADPLDDDRIVVERGVRYTLSVEEDAYEIWDDEAL